MSNSANKDLIIIAAPSGAGKSTFLEKILQEFPDLEDTVTCTTRPMRESESQGHPYEFISDEEFDRRRHGGEFAEWAAVHSYRYGTPRQALETIWHHGRVPIMDIDVQGARNLKNQYPQAKTIFIMPPSIEELRHRIAQRSKALPPDFELRLKNAEKEMAEAPSFDFIVLNDRFKESYAEFKKIIEEILKNR